MNLSGNQVLATKFGSPRHALRRADILGTGHSGDVLIAGHARQTMAPDGLSHDQAERRLAMWSATRREFAMIVSVGFTAPMDGKKLASAT